MSYLHRFVCDSPECHNFIDVVGEDSPRITLELNEWQTDPDDEELHYCDTCWPEVKKEIETDQEA